MADDVPRVPRPTPPLPPGRRNTASAFTRWRAARRNLFAALSPRLYRAWLAEGGPWVKRSYLVNQPDLVRDVLASYPKSPWQGRMLGDLLGNSVFVARGQDWARQRRMLDPGFDALAPRMTGAMEAASEAMVTRLQNRPNPVDIEEECATTAADIICRALFSRPITDQTARQIYTAFRRYQRSAPMVAAWDLLGLPRGRPRRAQRTASREIRQLITAMIRERQAELDGGSAPNDLATAIMTATDPQTGARFSEAEITDQIAFLFLAGHETSAAAMAWALYLLSIDPISQARAQTEGAPFTRNVIRETLRLYPPVAVLIREAPTPCAMRGKTLRRGAPVFVSPWHLGRHERLWRDPHVFDPDRWHCPETRRVAGEAYLPFSAGPRKCPGAGFALQELTIVLTRLIAAYRFAPVTGHVPEPELHLTVRAANGIWLNLERR